MIAQQIQTAPELQTEPIPRLLLDYHQASEATSIPERTLQERVKDGTIPSLKIGRLVRFSVVELEKWIASHFDAEREDVTQ